MDVALGFILLVAALLMLVSLGSWAVGQFTGLQGLIPGPIISAMLVIVIGIMLVFISASWGKPTEKFSVLYITILLGVALFLVIKLPSYIPSLYSTISNGTITTFKLSPLWTAIIAGGLLYGLYVYQKKK